MYKQELIAIGVKHLERAGTPGKTLSNYHLEAARSYYHSVAKTFEETDWESILYLFDVQLKLEYAPMVALNRIVPYAKVKGARDALAQLDLLEERFDFDRSSLFHAIKAELFSELNEPKKHQSALLKAIALSENDLVRKHYEKKMNP